MRVSCTLTMLCGVMAMLATAVAAIEAPPPAYTAEGEWLTHWSEDGDLLWTRHVGGAELDAESLTVAGAALVVAATASGAVSFGGKSLVLVAEPRTFLVRFALDDGRYLGSKITR